MPRHREFNYRLATDDDDRFRLGIDARFAGLHGRPVRLAWWGDRTKLYPDNPRWRPLIYTFALGVYGSSWTFYGAAGTAKQDGLLYIAGYFGPLVLLAFGIRFYERLVRLAKHQNATSISDFLSARFGRSRRIAVLVTIIALTAIIPYIALQLTAISMSIDVLTGAAAGRRLRTGIRTRRSVSRSCWRCSRSCSARAASTPPNTILAWCWPSPQNPCSNYWRWWSSSVFALTTLDSPVPMVTALRHIPEEFTQPSMFFAQALTAMFAFFCLPRQFHIGVVECADIADVRRARPWFAGYLVLLSIVVIPIVAASLPLDAAGRSAPSTDALVLWIPLAAGQEWLALFAYLGGFAAATGMVIVASVALATMISNDLVLPMLWRRRLAAGGESVASPAMILWVRRVAIVGVLLGAYAFFHLTPERADPGFHRHAVAGRGGAVRAGHHRRGVLARSEPRRRHGWSRGRLRHLDVHVADSQHRGRRWLAAAG